MFFLDKESALASALTFDKANAEGDGFVVWRYLSKRYKAKRDGTISAKPSAFNIRRKDGEAVEPTASLFELAESGQCSLINAVRLSELLITKKNFVHMDAMDASGSLVVSDVRELHKDPRVFKIYKSSPQKPGPLIHWDLEYAKDDREPDILIAKSALAHICKVYICGGKALEGVKRLQVDRG